jgi:hypothetical protein
MHQGEGGVDALVAQVREEVRHLLGGQHALVDEGSGGETGDVAAACVKRAGGVLDSFADDERAAFKFDAASFARDEDLFEAGHDRKRLGAEVGRIGGDVPPPEQAHPFVGDDVLDQLRDLACLFVVIGKEDKAGGVPTFGGQAEVDDTPEEPTWHLDQRAGSVAGVRLGPACPTMVKVDERFAPHLHDLVAAMPLHVHDEGDATGVVFKAGVVQTGPRLCV